MQMIFRKFSPFFPNCERVSCAALYLKIWHSLSIETLQGAGLKYKDKTLIIIIIIILGVLFRLGVQKFATEYKMAIENKVPLDAA